MTGILGSYRWRRRIVWTLPIAAVAVGFAILVALLPRGGGIPDDEPIPEQALPVEPQPVAPAPRKVPVTRTTRREVNQVLRAFMRQAVARENPEAAWALVTPALRSGSTRAEWRRGNLPVYPFPVRVEEATGWHVVESFENDLLVDLVMHARPGSERGAIAYQIELKRLGKGKNRRWLVDSIIPERVYTPALEEPRGRGAASAAGPPDSGARLSLYWLAVPGFLLSLIVLVPVTIALVSWRRGVRAERVYRRSL